MSNYSINIRQPRPSMSLDCFPFAGKYPEAVAEAQRLWKKSRRTVTLTVGSYWYHRITEDGTARDRNFNSGIPALEQL